MDVDWQGVFPAATTHFNADLSLDLDATMDTYLPAFRDIDVQTPMTVRHLYTHTNGLWGHWGDELHDFEEVISEYYPYLEIGVRHGYNGARYFLAKIIFGTFF